MKQELLIEPASESDVPSLVALVNKAYRGESSKKGWTTEADLLGGIRIDEENLRNLMHSLGSVVLQCSRGGTTVGCVHLQKNGSLLYLGMLTVLPELQGSGIGRELLEAAEAYALHEGCNAITMTVISIRDELIRWYERRGYRTTGERKAFPDDPRFGLPKQKLEFVVLQKNLEQPQNDQGL